MTYKEIIDRIATSVANHQMLEDFGYGELSDIKVGSIESDEADYPYLFLNPTNHSRTGNVVSYNFNMIVMDIAQKGDSYLEYTKIQSHCQQYIDDIISEFYFDNSPVAPQILINNVTYTPFKERFQDTVAGMTAVIQIEISQPINKCVAPIYPIDPTPPVNCILSDWSDWSYCTNDEQFRTRTIIQQPEGAGLPCGPLIETRACVLPTCNLICEVANLNYLQGFDPETGNPPIGADTIILDTYNAWRPLQDGGNFYTPTTFDPLTWTIIGVVRIWEAYAQPGDIFPQPFMIQDTSTYGAPIYYAPTQVFGWPTQMPAIGEEIPFTLVYEAIVPDNLNQGFEFVILKDEVGVPEAAIEVLPGVHIQICQTGI